MIFTYTFHVLTVWDLSIGLLTRSKFPDKAQAGFALGWSHWEGGGWRVSGALVMGGLVSVTREVVPVTRKHGLAGGGMCVRNSHQRDAEVLRDQEKELFNDQVLSDFLLKLRE